MNEYLLNNRSLMESMSTTTLNRIINALEADENKMDDLHQMIERIISKREWEADATNAP